MLRMLSRIKNVYAGFRNIVFAEGARMSLIFIKFRALFSTSKQIICHNTKKYPTNFNQIFGCT